MGGGSDQPSCFSWLISGANGGDFLVIRGDGTDAYNPWLLSIGPLNSASTLIILNREGASDPFVLSKVDSSEAIFFSGGDQWEYITRFRDTPLQKAVQKAVISRNCPLGGTSAGTAIMAQFLFTASSGGTESSIALKNPFDPSVTISNHSMFQWPPLQQMFVDMHFRTRQRLGRLIAFGARAAAGKWLNSNGTTEDQTKANAQDGDRMVRLIGVDEATCLNVALPSGIAQVMGVSTVDLVQFPRSSISHLVPDQPLGVSNLHVQRLNSSGSSVFNLLEWNSPANSDLNQCEFFNCIGILYQIQVNQGVIQPDIATLEQLEQQN